MIKQDQDRLRELRNKLLMYLNGLVPTEKEEYDTLLNMDKNENYNYKH